MLLVVTGRTNDSKRMSMSYVELEYFNAHCNPALAISPQRHTIRVPWWHANRFMTRLTIPQVVHRFDWTTENGHRYLFPVVDCKLDCAVPPDVHIGESLRARIINKELPGHPHFCVIRRASLVRPRSARAARRTFWEPTNPLPEEYGTLLAHQTALTEHYSGPAGKKNSVIAEVKKRLSLFDRYHVNHAIATSSAGQGCALMEAWLNKDEASDLEHLRSEITKLNGYLGQLLASSSGSQ